MGTGPSFCWHCGSKLDEVSYAKMSDQIGNVHRVHLSCLPAAQRSVTTLTVDVHEVPKWIEEKNWDD